MKTWTRKNTANMQKKIVKNLGLLYKAKTISLLFLRGPGRKQ